MIKHEHLNTSKQSATSKLRVSKLTYKLYKYPEAIVGNWEEEGKYVGEIGACLLCERQAIVEYSYDRELLMDDQEDFEGKGPVD